MSCARACAAGPRAAADSRVSCMQSCEHIAEGRELVLVLGCKVATATAVEQTSQRHTRPNAVPARLVLHLPAAKTLLHSANALSCGIDLRLGSRQQLAGSSSTHARAGHDGGGSAGSSGAGCCCRRGRPAAAAAAARHHQAGAAAKRPQARRLRALQVREQAADRRHALATACRPAAARSGGSGCCAAAAVADRPAAAGGAEAEAFKSKQQQ